MSWQPEMAQESVKMSDCIDESVGAPLAVATGGASRFSFVHAAADKPRATRTASRRAISL